jgi:uncharacterized protein (DUF4415 family)
MSYSLTKTERLARQKLYRHLWEMEEDSLDLAMRHEVPEAWHTLEADLDVIEKRVKVTLYLDASVAQFYRAMGKGYQERINRILSTWANLKIAGMLELETAVRRRFGWIMDRERTAMAAGVTTPGFGARVKGPEEAATRK